MTSAEPLIHAYLEKHPHDFEALYFTGVIERGLGNYADAEKAFASGGRAEPKSCGSTL